MDAVLKLFGLSPEAALGLLVAVAVFATFLSIALPLMSGREMKTRMRSVALERDELRARERARMASERDAGRGKGLRKEQDRSFAARVVEKLELRNALLDDAMLTKLKVAGLRTQRATTLFLFCRVALPLVFGLLAAFYIFGLGLMDGYKLPARIFACISAAYAGFYAPNFYVKNRAAKRGQSIGRAWPDALDLLLICVESGNSIEAAFRRVADEIGIQSIELAEELVLVCAELSYLPERRQAYENLVSRTGMESVRSVSTALIQAERYGTPLGVALRTMSQESRDMRMMAAEKKAAALPPKLTVPMILFFLPVLFAVIIGPAVIQIMQR
ncbi:type II secretion system F family protein [Aureimonas phyllosphaerae]|uniref:Tight adherence protein C n=1 Tax=Aureimonas phyllosphaerae TaxID=1166078 RepID=A0A7W6BUJ5_9HYPH|nr:type II secretion system F family protein [Aureimonas phyllosphaerae]MBB3933986.1 tight adherence protein C [Aureimonas phyllosphaerae]MBB3958798.1 tight adherence protein C [Aureimonas phyllosphaerae]SFF19525.1 tight adherence protein C [Aureimonas phyllosphaerae]